MWWIVLVVFMYLFVLWRFIINYDIAYPNESRSHRMFFFFVIVFWPITVALSLIYRFVMLGLVFILDTIIFMLERVKRK